MFVPDCPGVLGSDKEGHTGASHGGDHDLCYSIMHQNFNNWVLVIKNVDKMDEGRYICTVQTFPKESLIVFVRVDGTSNNQTGKCKMDKKKINSKNGKYIWPSASSEIVVIMNPINSAKYVKTINSSSSHKG